MILSEDLIMCCTCQTPIAVRLGNITPKDKNLFQCCKCFVWDQKE